MTQLRIPATYLRGGTSKGVFFRLADLPEAARLPGPARDALLLRVIGSPDPYGKQIDGMGGATSSTSKTVIVSPSSQPGHDIDYLFGQVSIDSAFVDWSGNCGNLSAAVGPFAIAQGLIDPARVPHDGIATVRVWQANIGKTIIAHVPMSGGEVQETGDFGTGRCDLPGRRSAALEFLDPAAEADGAAGSHVSHRAPDRRAGSTRRGSVRGDDDQCRHPDDLHRMPPHWGTAAASCRTRSMATLRRSRASRPSAPTGHCAWA